MPLLGTPKDYTPARPLASKSERFSLACELFRLGAPGEAYQLFNGIQGPGGSAATLQPALLVNLALCQMKAGRFREAMSLLEPALTELKKTPGDPTPADDTCKRLRELELAGTGYLSPLPEQAPALAPDYCKTTVRRLLVDCCAALELWEKVRGLAAALGPARYRNVEIALNNADNNRG